MHGGNRQKQKQLIQVFVTYCFMIAAYLDKTLMWRAAFHSPPQQDRWIEKSFMSEAWWDCGLKFNTVLRLKGLASFRPEVDILGNTNTEQSIYQLWVGDLNRRKTHLIWVRSAAVILPSSVQTHLWESSASLCLTMWLHTKNKHITSLQPASPSSMCYSAIRPSVRWHSMVSFREQHYNSASMMGWVLIVLNRLQYFCGSTYRDADERRQARSDLEEIL